MKVSDAPVIVEETFDARAQAVWNAITMVDEMREWYFDNIPAFEARVGFETFFLVNSEGREFPHRWKVVEVVPLEKISYDWRFDGYPGVGLVTFKLQEQGSTTTLKLTNTVVEDFPVDVPEFEWVSCLAGWQYFIGQSLRGYLEK